MAQPNCERLAMQCRHERPVTCRIRQEKPPRRAIVTTDQLIEAVAEHFVETGKPATCKDLAARLSRAESTVQRAVKFLLSSEGYRKPSAKEAGLSEGSHFGRCVIVEQSPCAGVERT